MKTRLLLAVSGLLLMLPACSHMEHKEHVAAAKDDGLDHVYMEKVERLSKRQGINIVWINPPRLEDSKTRTADGHH